MQVELPQEDARQLLVVVRKAEAMPAKCRAGGTVHGHHITACEQPLLVYPASCA